MDTLYGPQPRKQEVPKSTPSDQGNQANVEEAADEEEAFLTKSREKMLVRYLGKLVTIDYTHSNAGLAQLALNMAEFYQLQPGKKGKKSIKFFLCVGCGILATLIRSEVGQHFAQGSR